MASPGNRLLAPGAVLFHGGRGQLSQPFPAEMGFQQFDVVLSEE
jgi:hypothetical protein